MMDKVLKTYRLGLFASFLLSVIMFSCTEGKKQTQEVIAQTKPNILLFIAEDLSPDLGFDGNNLVQTPHLDALATKGMRFANALTVSPMCAPSRTSLITGMYPQTLGAHHMRFPPKYRPSLPDSIKTIDKIFNQHGYVTANIDDGIGKGKFDWLFSYKEEAHFDAKTWKEIASKDAPFFAMLSTPYTHRPFDEVSEDRFPLDSISIPPYYPNHKVTQEDFAGYYASIETLDAQFGQVMDSLKHYSLEENTIIIFWADHGRPMTRDKMFNYISGLKVPQIIYFPEGIEPPKGYQANGIFEPMISSVDLSATILDLAGIDVPQNFQGEVFWDWGSRNSRKLAFSGTDRVGESNFKSRSVFDGKYHYIRNYNRDFSINSSSTAYKKAHHPIYHLLEILGEKGQLTDAQQQLLQPLPYEELYDLESDPHEIKNLVDNASMLSILEKKRIELDSMMVVINDKGMEEDAPEIVEAFKQYGVNSLKHNQERINRLRAEVMSKVE